jgi:heme/copper-type cytochrome/quinol oxidase subunit 3
MYIRSPITAGPIRRQRSIVPRFALLTIAVFGMGGLLAAGLILLSRGAFPAVPIYFPRGFVCSTLLLIAGSLTLQRAVAYVRIERQRPFRRCLLLALGMAVLFLGTQGEGLWALVVSHARLEETADAVTFISVLATLHGMHFTLAILFLEYVLVRAWDDAYDHEYYWGVSACAVFWHFLAIVWGGILGVFGVAWLTYLG